MFKKKKAQPLPEPEHNPTRIVLIEKSPFFVKVNLSAEDEGNWWYFGIGYYLTETYKVKQATSQDLIGITNIKGLLPQEILIVVGGICDSAVILKKHCKKVS